MWVLRTAKGRRIAIPALPATIGCGDGADVSLPHASIQERHARLSAGAAGTLNVEAVGDAVVGIDRKRVRRGEVAPGDSLILGRLRFTVEASDPTAGHGTPAGASAGAEPPASARPKRPRSSWPEPDQGRPERPRPDRPRPDRPRPARPQPAAAPRRPRSEGGDEELIQVKTKTLQYSVHQGRRGLLHADLSQLSGSVKLLIAVGLLLLAAALVWGVSLAVDLAA